MPYTQSQRSKIIQKAMRPYQIAATEAILSKIEISNNYHKVGTRDAGGYVWHTTGSGKTLTSFKTAQLATNLPYIDKVLFVVDRKDLDYQTMKEYDRFEKGAANGNTSTKILEKQLDPSSDARIVVTTIQKLDNFIKKNPGHPIYDKHGPDAPESALFGRIPLRQDSGEGRHPENRGRWNLRARPDETGEERREPVPLPGPGELSALREALLREVRWHYAGRILAQKEKRQDLSLLQVHEHGS